MVTLFLWLLKALENVVIADALISWFANKDTFPRSITSQIADPLCSPFRALSLGGLDLSPMPAILMLQVIHNMIARCI